MTRYLLGAALLLLSAPLLADDADLDVVYVPTPDDVVTAMLELAKVAKDDIVYDLGCGDGRIVAAAAKATGCKGVGIDISPDRVRESLALVEQANVSHLVKIQQADIFDIDLSEATVVTLYLLPPLNRRLVPQLEKMKPGSRIVSHEYDGLDELGIVPETTVRVISREDNTSHMLYLWTIPFNKKKQPTVKISGEKSAIGRGQ